MATKIKKKPATGLADAKKRFAKAIAPKADPKYINVPNICFSLTKKDDEREPKYVQQRLKRGFDNSETWSLKDTMARFILPRLKLYKELSQELSQEIIMDTDGLYDKVDKSIRAFEIIVKDGDGETLTKEEWKEYDKGMEAFVQVYMRLW